MKTERVWFKKAILYIIAYINIKMDSDESNIKVVQDKILKKTSFVSIGPWHHNGSGL